MVFLLYVVVCEVVFIEGLIVIEQKWRSEVSCVMFGCYVTLFEAMCIKRLFFN